MSTQIRPRRGASTSTSTRRSARRGAARVIALKRARRVAVGRYLSFVFENRETVLFQIQEMCRAERIVDDAKVAGGDRRLQRAACPRPGELSATLFIEIADMDADQARARRASWASTPAQYVWLQVGREFAVPGDFEAGHSDEEKGKLTAVHFVRFRFSPRRRAPSPSAEVHWRSITPPTRARDALSDETRATRCPRTWLE